LGPAQDMLMSGALTSADRDRVALIEKSARLLLEHVNDLLDIATSRSWRKRRTSRSPWRRPSTLASSSMPTSHRHLAARGK
jgi:hypothetical protein